MSGCKILPAQCPRHLSGWTMALLTGRSTSCGGLGDFNLRVALGAMGERTLVRPNNERKGHSALPVVLNSYTQATFHVQAHLEPEQQSVLTHWKQSDTCALSWTQDLHS